MPTAEEIENEKLKELEKRRVTKFLRVSQDDFKKVAEEGDRVYPGQIRRNSGALGIFKNTMEKPPKTVGTMKYTLPKEVQDYISRQVCPEDGTPLDKVEEARQWRCPECGQTYAVIE